MIVPRPAGTRPATAGVRVHGARRWSADDVAEPMPGLAATSPARTVLDLAGTDIGDRRLRHVVQVQVAEKRQVSLDEIEACLARVGGRGVSGAGRLRRLLTDLGWGGEEAARSELERRLAKLLDHRFQGQVRPPWYDGLRGVVDLAEPRSRVIVEADGRRWHATEQAMAADRRRDRLATANGWLVIRVTWDDVVNRPEVTAAEIQATVARRSRLAA